MPVINRPGMACKKSENLFTESLIYKSSLSIVSHPCLSSLLKISPILPIIYSWTIKIDKRRKWIHESQFCTKIADQFSSSKWNMKKRTIRVIPGQSININTRKVGLLLMHQHTVIGQNTIIDIIHHVLSTTTVVVTLFLFER